MRLERLSEADALTKLDPDRHNKRLRAQLSGDDDSDVVFTDGFPGGIRRKRPRPLAA